ncbi:MAG: CAP domain-containing protein [Cyclobacteriaceae bacterium]|nr:CAP domain-containing protein [Cyclobacteriaceae bacterium]MDH4298250.1 CAP domain-containing protein [Cyclobacteriaceae bacterium]MDH5249641.1 CAP domain-containing protein [Cyclobacteriaceae bacterium]
MKAFSLLILFIILVGFYPRPQPTDKICLSAEEKILYDLIMEYRKSKKLGTIPLSQSLTLVAQTHARDLSENYSFDPKNRCSPHSWSTKGNWTPCCYTNDHKQANCMWTKPKEIAGYAGNGFEIAYYSSLGANAKEGLDGWKISAGHNPLLINSGSWEKVKWKAIGIGVYKEYGLVWFGEDLDEKTPYFCD